MLKTIYFQTNYNNKMACNAFLHIDQAPRATIPESVLNETKIEIRTSDNSHPPVIVQLVDLIRLPLNKMPDGFTFPSHGCTALELYSELYKQLDGIDHEAKMAVYFYKKIVE